MSPRVFVTVLALALVILTWKACRGPTDEGAEARERWQFHANNTTTVHFKDGVTCFYHEQWKQMSCVYNNATYGPKEY